MNWNKVVENLREQTNYYAKQANEWELRSGYQERVKQYRASADIASILAAALTAGLDKSEKIVDLGNEQSQITP